MKARHSTRTERTTPEERSFSSGRLHEVPGTEEARFLIGRRPGRRRLGQLGSKALIGSLLVSVLGLLVVLVPVRPFLMEPESFTWTPSDIVMAVAGFTVAALAFMVVFLMASAPRLVSLTSAGLEADSPFQGRARIPLNDIESIELRSMGHLLDTEMWKIHAQGKGGSKIELGQGLPKAELEWLRARLHAELERLRDRC